MKVGSPSSMNNKRKNKSQYSLEGTEYDSRKLFKKQISLQVFVLVGIVYIFVFSYIPMFGLIMGFKDYDIVQGIPGIFTSKWVGLKYFIEFFSDINFAKLVRNTVCISVLKLIFTFPFPILFALMLNDLRGIWFKKIVQTASYLPHFISWVIISGISFRFLSSTGLVNELLMKIHLFSKPVEFLSSAKLYWGLAVFLDIWKEMGWWTIIFLAAIAGVNNDMNEAAEIDGATRLQRTWYIILPTIRPTIVTVLILAMGNLFGGGLSGSNFEQSYLLGNYMNAEASDIIQTYVFKVGLAQGRYAYATAVGMIQSIISLILILASNKISRKVAGSSLF